MTTLSSLEFEENMTKAEKAADRGPVFITQDGRTAYVLLTIECYRNLLGQRPTSIVDILALDGDADCGFEAPRCGEIFRAAELS